MNKTITYQATAKFATVALMTLLLSLIYLTANAATHNLPNGLKVVTHTPDDLHDWISEEDGSLILQHPAGGRLEMLSGPDDPRFPRNDITQFVPLNEDHAIQALGQLQGISPQVTVEIFLLPSPPVMTLGSFARRNVIFLSPGFGPVSMEAVASVTVHELGHVLTWAYFDQHPDRWNEYLNIRNLDADENGSSAPHADRAREILAEDIRFLFGGNLANSYDGIENNNIARPDEVDGLEQMLQSQLSGNPFSPSKVYSKAFPNPCNPQTSIEMQLTEGQNIASPESAVLEIVDIRGKRVRLITGGQLHNNRIMINWNGTDNCGKVVSSGKYFYRIKCGAVASSGSIALVK